VPWNRLPTVIAPAFLVSAFLPSAGGCSGNGASGAGPDAQPPCTATANNQCGGGPGVDSGGADGAIHDGGAVGSDGGNDSCCSGGDGGPGWSGILAPSRAIDWAAAGLPATFPDGETTPNPWTPPTRAQCGATLNPLGGGQDDSAQINAALAHCSAQHFVLLGPGTFTLKNTIAMNGLNSGGNFNNVTLRGSGASSTILSGGGIGIGGASGQGSSLIASGLQQGSSQVVGSDAPPVGTLAWFTQCDTGYSASDSSYNLYPAKNQCLPSNGSGHVDNGGLFVCGYDPVCANNSTDAPSNPHYQEQWVLVTSVTGSGPYTVTFTPGLYLQNWSTDKTASLVWQDPTWVNFGMGVEDVTMADGAGISLDRAYASWVKGVRFVGAVSDQGFLDVHAAAHSLLMNNYFYNTTPGGGSNGDVFNSSDSGGLGETDGLYLNNIMQEGIFEGGGAATGDVYAYNLSRDSQTDYPQNSEFMHHGGAAFILREGNQMGVSEDDDTWGSHNLNTWFRNYYSAWDPPYPSTNYRALWVGSFSRFDNAIGNALGSAMSTNYEDSWPMVFSVNGEGKDMTGLTEASFMRWGNYAQCTADSGGSHCNAASWCGDSSSTGWSTTCGGKSDVPTSLPGNAAPYSNPVPASTNLPASFFMDGMTAHPSGGTGLSWWKVCTDYPTCSSSQTPPMPPIGPDVTGGLKVDGHAYDIPAALAWSSLPIDSSYQSSYTVTGSSWSTGTETLTISSSTALPGAVHTNGGFQLTGAPSACLPSSGASFTGRADGEVLMTAATTTSISYALASDPGTSCAGTAKWPDVRLFDERVYQNDP
jgi:hypothetical protein